MHQRSCKFFPLSYADPSHLLVTMRRWRITSWLKPSWGIIGIRVRHLPKLLVQVKFSVTRPYRILRSKTHILLTWRKWNPITTMTRHFPYFLQWFFVDILSMYLPILWRVTRGPILLLRAGIIYHSGQICSPWGLRTWKAHLRGWEAFDASD